MRWTLGMIAVLGTGCFAELPPGQSVTSVDFRLRDHGVSDLGSADSGPGSVSEDARASRDATAAGPDAFRLTDARAPDAEPDAFDCVPREETCDGRDEDCDGAIDEAAVCGAYVVERCTLSLGHSTAANAPSRWACSGVDRINGGEDRCVSTEHTARFRSIRLAVPVVVGHELGVRFECEDPSNPALATWIQSRCRLFLGHADNRGEDGVPAWGPCPLDPNGDGVRCTSTGGDGEWHALTLPNTPSDDDDFGVAWICVDDEHAARAAALAKSVEVFLGAARDPSTDFNRSATWGDCPQAPADDTGEARCTSTRGDLLFHELDLAHALDGGGQVDSMGIALVPRIARDE